MGFLSGLFGGGGFGGGLFGGPPMPPGGIMGGMAPPMPPPGVGMIPQAAIPVPPPAMPVPNMPMQYAGGPNTGMAQPVFNPVGADRQAFINTVAAEAGGYGGGGPAGQNAVAEVIRNRIGPGDSAMGVVTEPKQFSPWNNGKSPLNYQLSPQQSADIWAATEPARYGSNFAGGADYFANPGASTASWPDIATPNAQFGAHKFYSSANNPMLADKMGGAHPYLGSSQDIQVATAPVTPPTMMAEAPAPTQVAEAPQYITPDSQVMGAGLSNIPFLSNFMGEQKPMALGASAEIPVSPPPLPTPKPQAPIGISGEGRHALGDMFPSAPQYASLDYNAPMPLPDRNPGMGAMPEMPPLPDRSPVAGYPPLPDRPPQTNNTYALQAGDNPWAVAKRLGIPFAELMGLNPMTASQSRSLPVGYQLQLPVGY